MVGPGEVDDELEPEVREECNGKYGAVVQVVIFEIPKAVPEEAVRIFVEFQRVESAIKGKCGGFCVWLWVVQEGTEAVGRNVCIYLIVYSAWKQTRRERAVTSKQVVLWRVL